ncbi:hypothetical protein [Puia dinghuensis]|nr:hypothetical protein [Puia dinghuensis]
MEPIIQHLFQVSSLGDISRQRLEAFVEEYPSFGIGHYLLSRKLKAEGSERYAAVTQTTSLYFTNPFWLQWQLENEIGETASLPAGDDLAEALSGASEEGFTTEEEDHMTAGEGEAIEGGPVHVEAEENNGPSAAELLLLSIEEAKNLRETLHKINHDFDPDTAVAGEIVPEAPGEEDAAPVITEAPIRDEEPPFVLDESEEPAATAPVAEANGTAGFSQAEPVAEPAAVFEPYHTIDYFASQGIRLTPDENPTDVLGKQVKSFTDWLKSMRRLPQKDREVVPDRVAEQAVQTIAAHSIEGKEVVTETMAEVLAKQGMREKARVVYEKLSLLNPDKRAYFAAKIEQLNIP